MSLIQIIVLAIVQGLTEFLPISSSGHLVLVPVIFGWSDQGLAFDVAAHFGSLVAVLLFFRTDIAALIRGSREILGGQTGSIEARLAACIALGTIPAALAGMLLVGWIEETLRSPVIVVLTLSGYAVLMLLVDRFGRKSRSISDIGIMDALLIGVAQALALVPGTSRSGVTITAAMALGFERQDAARFSFLLAAPLIVLATAFATIRLIMTGGEVAWLELGIAAVIAGMVAYASIELFMRVVNRMGLLPFAVYRLVLAAVIVHVFT